MLKILLKIANQLDQKGFYAEADLIDQILKSAITDEEYFGKVEKHEKPPELDITRPEGYEKYYGKPMSEERYFGKEEPEKSQSEPLGQKSVELSEREKRVLFLLTSTTNIHKLNYSALQTLFFDLHWLWDRNATAQQGISFLKDIESLILKIAEHARRFYPLKYKDEDFPDI